MRKKIRSNIQKISTTASRRSKKVRWVIGIDEVGRGPVAGPVTVCAFALKIEFLDDISKMGFRDSKKLSPQKRNDFANLLHNYAQLGMCTWILENRAANSIDNDGIAHAIKSALTSCLQKLNIHPEECDIYLDGGLHAPNYYFRQHTVIHGDDLFPVISCASILAKVYRDRMMENYDETYPEYNFFDNKGYGTPEHMKAIRKYGLSPLHRKSFLKSL